MNNNTNNPNNILPGLKSPSVLYPLIFIIFMLVIVMFYIFFKLKLPGKGETKSKEEMVSNIFPYSIGFIFVSVNALKILAPSIWNLSLL